MCNFIIKIGNKDIVSEEGFCANCVYSCLSFEKISI